MIVKKNSCIFVAIHNVTYLFNMPEAGIWPHVDQSSHTGLQG